MVFRYKHRANLLSSFPANSEMTSFKSISLCLCTCFTDSEVNLASDVALRSVVLSPFMLLQHTSTEDIYVRSVLTLHKFQSRVVGWQSPASPPRSGECHFQPTATFDVTWSLLVWIHQGTYACLRHGGYRCLPHPFLSGLEVFLKFEFDI